jgi:glycosyltransferase involved in cell wall biosynthesis
MARFLFIHNAFPGQFVHLCQRLVLLGHEVHGFGLHAPAKPIPGVKFHGYALPNQLPASAAFEHLQDLQVKLVRAEAALPALLALSKAGLHPDMVVAHPGWGEAIFAKDVWPDAVHLHYLEFFYGTRGRDTGFDPEFEKEDATPLHQAKRLRMKNVNSLLSLDAMDWGLSPTLWQRSTYPSLQQQRIDVVFDGIDTEVLAPRADAYITLGRGDVLRQGDPIVTFINRNFEPYRGYHIFMRALPKILRDHPSVRVVLVGGNSVSYGAQPPQGQTWRDVFLNEVRSKLDPRRVHFVGHVPREVLTTLMQVSACHVYLTYPFVLSWSCVEAMSVGVPIVASDTQPVREFLRNADNAHLVDFFDVDGLSDGVLRLLRERSRAQELGCRARAFAQEVCDLQTVALPRQLALLERLLNRSLQSC